MDKYEAELAVELNSICVNKGIKYYAYGTQYIHPLRKHPVESIILGSLGANSTTCASLAETSVVHWNAPAEFVAKKLAEKRAKDSILKQGASS